MFDNPFHEEIFPNLSKLPLVQLEVMSSCPMACYLGEETKLHLAKSSFQVQAKPPLVQLKTVSSGTIACLGKETEPHLATASFQVVVESDKVTPEPPLLQAKHRQLRQRFLIGLVLQTLRQCYCPSLDKLQHKLKGPECNLSLYTQ
ncbi:hypothetical protein WISP_24359 [Willisornis vidua]|uniref:Uncharacterized protein n=1 Tax=Willisornis vidua TaxID=1566151 RepID=A0ABQ9DMC5_9PASS|nr:hypothetical protein WISP_24359 [Willisornis vidua]